MAGPKVVFLGAAYPPEMLQYTRGLAEVGATVYGVGDTPVHGLPSATRSHLSDYLQVPRLLDREDVLTRVHSWLRGREVDLVLANWEVLVETAAALRVRLGLPGMRPDTVLGFRDKQIMKERVRAAGLRTPRSRRARTVAEVKAAAAEIGYPMIIKPVDGAGSADTYRVDSDAELDVALARQRHVPEVSCEEFVTGHEYTFDTVCVPMRHSPSRPRSTSTGTISVPSGSSPTRSMRGAMPSFGSPSGSSESASTSTQSCWSRTTFSSRTRRARLPGTTPRRSRKAAAPSKSVALAPSR